MQLRDKMQRGDTIVEVLVSIAVIGAVLSGAYVVVSSNTKNNQSAQERSTAVKLAESQLELLRSYVATPPGTLPLGGFCLEDGASVSKHTISSSLPAPSNTVPGYPPQCQIDSRYMIGIQTGAGDAELRSYTIFVTWDSLSGGRSQVSIAYKVARP